MMLSGGAVRTVGLGRLRTTVPLCLLRDSHALRRGPPCVFDECRPNPHTQMWLWVAFGVGLITVAMVTLFFCVVRDWWREKQERRAAAQRIAEN